MSTSTVTTRVRKTSFNIIIGAIRPLIYFAEKIAGDDLKEWTKKKPKRAPSYDPKSEKNAVKSS